MYYMMEMSTIIMIIIIIYFAFAHSPSLHFKRHHPTAVPNGNKKSEKKLFPYRVKTQRSISDPKIGMWQASSSSFQTTKI